MINGIRRIYVGYAALLAVFYLVAVFRGMGFAQPDRLSNVPKTVRDNPGAYRAHYRSYARYYGGK